METKKGVEILKKNKKISEKDKILDNIFKEYCLKRNHFNPNKITSPNMFSKKLQHRMKTYYNTLSSFSNSPKKY